MNTNHQPHQTPSRRLRHTAGSVAIAATLALTAAACGDKDTEAPSAGQEPVAAHKVNNPAYSNGHLEFKADDAAANAFDLSDSRSRVNAV